MSLDRHGRPALRWQRRAAAAVLWTERLSLALWPSLAIAAGLAGVALLGLPALLPVWLHLAMLVLTLAAVAWFGARGLLRLRVPNGRDAEARLERDSGLQHHPFAVLRDRPAATSAASLALWRLHTAQARRAVEALRLAGPDPLLISADPYALRAAAALLLASGLVIAGPQAGFRLAALFAPHLAGWQGAAAPLVQAWIQPPAYTGLPPIFLPLAGAAPSAISVPANSRVTVSITGLEARPSLSIAGTSQRMEPLGSNSFQAQATLTQSGHIGIGAGWSSLGGWDVTLIPNEPPRVAWAAPPGRAGASLSTRLPWQVAQRWGVAGLQADLRPQGRPDLPSLIVPLPLPGAPKDAKGSATEDLSENPYAGVMMTGRLVARDVSGQTASGAALDFILPARVFHHPLARAIADLRRRLALHPASAADAAADLAALGEAPVGAHDPSGLSPSGITLNLAAAAALLSGDPPGAKDRVAEAQARLWVLALALDGALPDAGARALAEARERLREAMEDRAQGRLSQKELAQRLDALREALDKRLAEIGKQAAQRGAIEKFDPRSQHLSSNALDKMMRSMEQAAREGRMDDARRAMAEMEKMLDQLKNAHIMTKEETQQRQEAARRGRQIMGAVQDLVRRETGLLDHAQSRAPAPAPPSFPQQGFAQQGLPPQFRGFPFPPMGGTDEPPDDPSAGAEPQSPAPGADETLQTPPPVPALGASPRQQQAKDARTQRALHRALNALSQGFAASGGQQPRSLDDAGHAMDDAAEALDAHQDPQARDGIGRVIAALQQGGQSMSRQMSSSSAGQMQLSLQPGGQSGSGGEGQEGEDGPDDGHGGRKKDPFGRQVDGNGNTADDSTLRVPEEMEQARSRAIQEELRRRGADRQRPKDELDYIDRLLKPF
jgi:uncharacterized protein (TIGR02302 family)